MEALVRDLERRGVERVRAELNAGEWPPPLRHMVSNWVSRTDHDASRSRESTQSEQMDTARSAKDAAWAAADAARDAARHAKAANTIARLALAAAIMGIVISALAFLRH